MAILKCDTFIPPIKERFGDVDAQFRNLFALSKVARVQADTFECKQMQFPEKSSYDRYNGFLVTGSRDSVNGKEEWVAELKKTIVDLHDQQKKIFGVCFGHQVCCPSLLCLCFK